MTTTFVPQGRAAVVHSHMAEQVGKQVGRAKA